MAKHSPIIYTFLAKDIEITGRSNESQIKKRTYALILLIRLITLLAMKLTGISIIARKKREPDADDSMELPL